MLKVGPLPQRMLKEPAGSTSPSSSSSASHRSSSLKYRRRTISSSKGKEKQDDHELDDHGRNQADGGNLVHSSRGPAEYHHPPHRQPRSPSPACSCAGVLGRLRGSCSPCDLRSLSVNKNAEIAGFLGSSAQIPV
ncbi:hypothetical protein PGTUg99_028634 [Puccinia graminis f. sp. tritici]|uniref:Uncharacterized protein n=1 Tax=Puccinia graminis f. sp. tritici TaxID=56615 RepID=A0A5B0NJ18_PUCGR|nr:hypothetical protein PGTUg99_027979 [Puccinia graminis f. sp. tritici]KAA1133380.1 hypothetical protein PGTUg99_028634 [Puccinia graminis f. sp. tritici]